MDLKQFTADLILEDQIYFSRNQSSISYPEKGNQDCYQIEESSFWFRHRNKCIVTAVKKYANQNLFFDIGGGNGFVAKELQKQGFDSVLVEPGVQGCLNAKARKLQNIICSTLEESNFKYNSIPNIGVFDVLEHIENDNQFLKMIHNYLLPEGLVFITVPAFNILWANEDVEAGHFRRYTTNTINRKLINNGFEILYSSYIFSLLYLPIFLIRTIPSRLGFNKNATDLKRHQTQHTNKNKSLEKLLSLVWNQEIANIKNGKRTIIGTSCFVVAKKV